jgi:hypothetical protein
LIVHWLVEQRSKEEMERVLEEELALLGWLLILQSYFCKIPK